MFRKYREEIIDYKEELEIMRSNFKQQKVKPLKLKKPEWMESDGLNKIYTNMDVLLQEGEVYWGSLVQANEVLFRKKPHVDLPCNVVFSTNALLNNEPQIMSAISSEIFSYKNTNKAPEYLQKIVEYVTDEMERVFNYPISLYNLYKIEGMENYMRFTQEDTLFFTTMMVFRKYIPGGVLTSCIFPIVAAPDITDISIILPKKYWTKKVKKMFLNK